MLLLPLLAACTDSPAAEDTDGTPKDTAPPADGLVLIDELDVPMARWGVDVPNTVKNYASAWDKTEGLLYVGGIQLPNILVIDPAEGHPTDGFAYELLGHHNPLLVGDFPHRRLYVLLRGNGGLIALDLQTREELWRNDAASEDGSSLVHFAAAVAEVDPSDGTLYVLEGDNGRVLAYDRDGVATTLVGPTAPTALAVDPAGDLLYVFESVEHSIYRYRPSTGEYEFFTLGPDEPYGSLVVADDGTVLLATDTLIAYAANGSPRWGVEPGGSALDLAVAGSVVAATVSDSTDDVSEEYNRTVTLFDVADGTSWEGAAEWGAEAITPDPAGGRFFVSNGSNGTISVIDAATGDTTSTIGVSNVPDTSVYDPVSATRFVLDRLGGSVIHAWRSDGSLETFAGGEWPTELAIDVEARRLYAPQHFTSSITAWDLDTFEQVDQLLLPFDPNTSDTMGDFTADVEHGLAAVVFPETGSYALFELNPFRLLWSYTEPLFEMGRGAGAGGGFVAIDVDNNQLYLFVGAHDTIEALSLTDGSPVRSALLSGHEKLAYNLNSMFLDPVDGQLYLGDDVLQTPELTATHLLDDLYRAVCRDGDIVYALRALDDFSENLVTLSPEDGTAHFVADVGVTTGMRMETECDLVERTITVSNLEQADVRVFRLPE